MATTEKGMRQHVRKILLHNERVRSLIAEGKGNCTANFYASGSHLHAVFVAAVDEGTSIEGCTASQITGVVNTFDECHAWFNNEASGQGDRNTPSQIASVGFKGQNPNS